MTFDQAVNGTVVTGALIGLAVALWGRLKALAWRAANLVVARSVVESPLSDLVAHHLWANGRRSRFGERVFGCQNVFVRPADRRLVAAYEEVGLDPVVFWFGWRPVLAAMTQMGAQGNLGLKLTLTFLRGTFDPTGLIQAAVDGHNHRRHAGSKRFTVHRVLGRDRDHYPPGMGKAVSDQGGMPPSSVESSTDRRWLRWRADEVGPPVPVDPLGPFALPPGVGSLVTEARRWLESERWYKERRIPWRLGWTLFGRPGTGKTSLAKAVAQDLDLPVFALEVGTFDDRDMIRAWRDALAEAPCMVVIEDLDAVFRGRDNRLGEQGGGLSFACLLNCLDGAEGNDGVILVITTNHVEDLDPALGVPDDRGESTRPGRIDRAVELHPLDEGCRRKVAARVFVDCPDEVEPAVAAGAGDTAAQFQARCCRTALARHWDRKRQGD